MSPQPPAPVATVNRTGFDRRLAAAGTPLRRSAPRVLQLNVGKLCNLTCVHCHVNAGPNRKEIITAETVDRVLGWFAAAPVPVLDLTGGSPEMAPDFRRIIETVRALAQPRQVIDRFNATIVQEPGYGWVPGFLAEHRVTVVASMPCYSPDNVNAQRGDGVFDRSIDALQQLNALGYGSEPDLELNLVYNPNGAFLPGDQAGLEADYKRELLDHFGIRFNQLYCLANMPIARFASYLKHNGLYADYLQTLKDAFNPATVDGLMCRDTLSVSWEGDVFDCDFNQMLGLPPGGGTGPGPRIPKLWDLDASGLSGTTISTGDHCYGCTAGAGSSCGGQLA